MLSGSGAHRHAAAGCIRDNCAQSLLWRYRAARYSFSACSAHHVEHHLPLTIAQLHPRPPAKDPDPADHRIDGRNFGIQQDVDRIGEIENLHRGILAADIVLIRTTRRILGVAGAPSAVTANYGGWLTGSLAICITSTVSPVPGLSHMRRIWPVAGSR